MDLYQKISVLGPGAQYDTCGPRDLGQTTSVPGVYYAKTSTGQTCRLFKVLQTNHCQNNCRYCAFRRDRDTSRVSTTPDEMALAFDSAYRRRLVDGLFLSSGIVGTADTTMARLIDTVSILRQKFSYRGYVHLKIMPGSSADCLRQALSVSNRLSLNIESPTQSDLTTLSPDKNLHDGFFKTLLLLKYEIDKLKQNRQKSPSLTTQFIVGAGTETDIDIIHSTNLLYQQFQLQRVFYSAFRPISNTPLSDQPATPLVRQNRLYQADFLMRFYRFAPSDFCLTPDGSLSFETDPKTAWAHRHPEFYPVNLNTADFWDLLKVPGLGPTSVKKIITLRQSAKINSLSRFSGLRLQLSKISPYISF